MIDIGLLKAARALAGKSQKEFAELATVSPATLAEIELGNNNPTHKTERLLLSALEKCGVEIRDGAVRRLNNRIRILDGDDCYIQLLDDVIDHMATQDRKEVCLFYGSDSLSLPTVIERYRQLKTMGVRIKQLVEEGDRYLSGDLHDYRYVPQAYFINRVAMVYGDKYAYVVKGSTKQVVLTHDAVLADMQRSQFSWLFSISKVPEVSDADIRF